MLFIFILDEGAHPIAIYGKARQRLLGNINLSVQSHQKNESPVRWSPNINVIALVSCQIQILKDKIILVIMMCGLPCSGKSTWVEKHMNENRAKHFHLIGNECIMDRKLLEF